MASIYTHKDSNIRKTFLLFAVFLIVVIGIGWLFGYAFDSPIILWVAVVLSVTTAIISFWHSDKIVLKMTNAVPIDMRNYPEIYRIVENLSITAGLPMPRIYLVREQAPNAFATGRNPEKAVIAVTEGLLDKLDRTELEGVIAHELSHIGNRDMLVSTVAVVLVGFVAILSDIFLRSVFFRSMFGGGGNRNSGGVVIIIGIVLAILAPIGAALIHLAISRKRELLADASGSFLTRYPDGLASALTKISKDNTPMRVANNSTSHLWLDDPFKGKNKRSFWHKLFMTHPPTEERVKALNEMAI